MSYEHQFHKISMSNTGKETNVYIRLLKKDKNWNGIKLETHNNK